MAPLTDDMLSVIALALAANAAVAAAGYGLRTVTPSGAVSGAALGSIILLSVGWEGWGLLLLTFALAVATSRMGLARKRRLGIDEERQGRRGANNALANTGVAALAGLLAALTDAREPALVAFVAALAAGGSDTAASEVGKAFGRRTYLVTTLREVPPGTPGGMSIEGTAAGLLGAAALGGVAVLSGLVAAITLLPVVAGATAGALVESALGATLEPRGILNNDALNVINTGIAALVAVLLF